MKGISNK